MIKLYKYYIILYNFNFIIFKLYNIIWSQFFGVSCRVTAIISKPGRSFPHWLASILHRVSKRQTPLRTLGGITDSNTVRLRQGFVETTIQIIKCWNLKIEDSKRAPEKWDPYCAHSPVTAVVIRTSNEQVWSVWYGEEAWYIVCTMNWCWKTQKIVKAGHRAWAISDAGFLACSCHAVSRVD
jgi:hypothetical protein